MKYELLIIGCGEIGTSLIDGWLNKSKKYKKKIYFIDVDKIKTIKKKFKYVFLSFKPKNLNYNLNLYKNLFDKNTIFYSVLAGKKLLDIQNFFPVNKNIIRLMLNTPVSVNKGTIIFYSLKKKNKSK